MTQEGDDTGQATELRAKIEDIYIIYAQRNPMNV